MQKYEKVGISVKTMAEVEAKIGSVKTLSEVGAFKSWLVDLTKECLDKLKEYKGVADLPISLRFTDVDAALSEEAAKA